MLLRSQLSQNVMLYHWGNNFLKHHSPFIFRFRHFFLDFSTYEDEGTTILQNAGKYSPNDRVKTQKTWILSNETNNSFKLRCVTESLTELNHLKGNLRELILVSGPTNEKCHDKDIITLHMVLTFSERKCGNTSMAATTFPHSTSSSSLRSIYCSLH